MSIPEATSSGTPAREQGRQLTWLVRIGSASSPLEPPQLYPLEDTVRLGRAAEVARSGHIEVRDPWMSSEHAELERSDEGWRLLDMGSSNGTRTWGRRRSSVLLANGDVFETGSTFWLFRSEAVVGELPTQLDPLDPLATLSPEVARLTHRLAKVAKSRVPVVIEGPTGAGKEVFARFVHRCSGRPGRLVPLDLAALAPEDVARELFGAEGPDGHRPGRLRSADEGTVLVDQVADMPQEVQVALLRVLEGGELTPVGSDIPVRLDLRLVTTAAEHVDELVEQGRLRAELWSRLKGFVVTVPPLRHRLEDLGLLVGRFLVRLGAEDTTFSPEAYRALLTYDWPHNIRELERTVESATALSDRNRVELVDLPPEAQRHEAPRAAPELDTEHGRERELIRLLTAHRGNVSAVARSMGYSRMQVHRWMKQMNVDPNQYRERS